MTKESNFQKFLQKAKTKHGDTFDYSMVKYKKQKVKVDIICKKHGIFSQTPDKHLQSKYGCQKCANLVKGKHIRTKKRKSIYTIEHSTNCLQAKYQNRFIYNFSKFNNTHDGIVICICKIHGQFEQTLKNLLMKNNKNGCRKCSIHSFKTNKTKSYDNFVKMANKIYNNFYQYPDTNRQTYTNRTSIITITCPIHGNFEKRAQKHLSKQGCLECMYQNLIKHNKLPGGYCEETFNQNPKLKLNTAFLYYMKINNGKFYKIGISIDPKKRISSLKHKSKNYIKSIQIIDILELNLYDCFLIEQEILKKYSYARSPRRWSTEIFNEDILKNTKLSYFIKSP